MEFITPIYFTTYTKSIDNSGDKVKTPNVERKVFRNKLSIGQKEFYEAHTSGLKPEFKFEVRKFEYKGEDTLKYNDVTYSIIRTFENLKKGTIELTCSKPIMKVM